MKKIRSIEVQFDLSDPDQALTYERLKESSRRAHRITIAGHARRLLEVMMGVRLYQGVEDTGLAKVPNFPAQLRTYNRLLQRAVAIVAGRVDAQNLYANALSQTVSRQRHAPQPNQEV